MAANGTFFWYELMTTDTAAAKAFYGQVAGWDMGPSAVPGVDYTVLIAVGTGVGGIMTLPPEACAAGAQPGWFGYILTPDVDRASADVVKAGGAMYRPPADIPGIGRFSVVADPQGAAFMLMTPNSAMPAPPPPADGALGHAGWRELWTTDQDAALAFHASQFGWTKGMSVDIGPGGVYQLFNASDTQMGGIGKIMPGMGPPAWTFYFNVDAIDPAAARVTAAGGTILNGPMEVPGGAWVLVARDPQGAMFGLLAPPKPGV